MEHVNTSNLRQQQQQQTQQQQLQQHQLEQQNQHNDNQQQFCLRWHNHQTSLLSTLPVLLDQSHLTDVTISAEGRTLRAHRVVLSACSTFFMELFRALESSAQPVIIIPGATFAAIVALLTFMYSGEVNVYEEQIPMLLNLAETLGIKGLADVQHNAQKSSKRATDFNENPPKESTPDFERPVTPATPTPPTLLTPCAPPIVATPTPLLPNLSTPNLVTPLLTNKLGGCTPLENFFLKSLQFYPNLLPQPLNFSQTALCKTTELLAKYQQQCNLYQGALSNMAQQCCKEQESGAGDYETKNNTNDEAFCAAKRLCTRENTQQQSAAAAATTANPNVQQQQKDIKRLDKIVEHLRGGCSEHKSGTQLHANNDNATTTPISIATTAAAAAQYGTQQTLKSSPSPNYLSSSTPLYTKASSYANTSAILTSPQQQQQHTQLGHSTSPYILHEDHAKLQQHIEQYAAANCNAEPLAATRSQMLTAKSEPNLLALSEKLPAPSTPTKPPSNSKLYATCFICHKQLSNQYNLRVHLETHQNVRYACNVCSHVSRSKDALRKHVSYRHPGAPSPCESEARRKRISKLSNLQSNATLAGNGTATSSGNTLTTQQNTSPPATSTSLLSSNFTASNTLDMAAQLSRNPYLFLPNQFHFAAASSSTSATTTTTSAADDAHSPLANSTSNALDLATTATTTTTMAAISPHTKAEQHSDEPTPSTTPISE